jgi:hypothetical protein
MRELRPVLPKRSLGNPPIFNGLRSQNSRGHFQSLGETISLMRSPPGQSYSRRPVAWMPRDLLTKSPFHSVYRTLSTWFPPPFQDAVEAPDDAFRMQGKVDLDAQPLAVEIVQHVPQPECPAILQSLSHEVRRPGHIWGIRHRQRGGLVAFQPLARPSPWASDHVRMALA